MNIGQKAANRAAFSVENGTGKITFFVDKVQTRSYNYREILGGIYTLIMPF